jgi:hypothetical protein
MEDKLMKNYILDIHSSSKTARKKKKTGNGMLRLIFTPPTNQIKRKQNSIKNKTHKDCFAKEFQRYVTEANTTDE